MVAPDSSILPIHRFASFAGANVAHGITGRTAALPAHGDVSYVTAADPVAVRGNRRRWSEAIGVLADAWVCARQVHGTRVAVVEKAHAGRGADAFESALPATDILMTATPGLPLAVFCADCVPVLLHDPILGVVAAVHAGWRGTTRDSAGAAVRAMREQFGTNPANLRVGIGPSIGPCCYEVGAEVIAAWHETGLDGDGQAVRKIGDRQHFDLWAANVLALTAAGVPRASIEVAGICTRCHADAYFSHRARQGAPGRFAAVIALGSSQDRGACR